MKIAFTFPGQGVQRVGMAGDFISSFDYAKEMLDEAKDASGIDMKALLIKENEKINITEYTQPALVTACMIIEKAIRNEGIDPYITAGLSLGEYCALISSGALDFKDGIRLTRIRGKLMSTAVPAGIGTMAAIIGLPQETVESTLSKIEEVSIANYNCPGQIVISGKKESVYEAMEALKSSGARRVVELNVSGPFHSILLKDAGKKLGEELQKVTFKKLVAPYIANLTSEIVTNETKIRELLERQVYSNVLWEQTLLKLREKGVDLILEIGPGNTIAGFVKKTIPEIPVIGISTIEDVVGLRERIKEVAK